MDDDDDELAPHHVLEALTVPELPYDFTDRVMGSLHADPRASLLPRRIALPWVVAACTSAAAIAALAMLWLARAPEPALVPAPVLAPMVASEVIERAPVPVAAPAPMSVPVQAHLVLSVMPHDAVVRLDGDVLAGPSPFIATNLPPGGHTLVIERDGFTAWTRTIDVPRGELDLPITLQPIAPADDASIVPASPRPGLGRKDKVERGSPDLKDPFDKGDPLASADAAAPGILRIGTEPGAAPASVFLDGKLLGTTPIAAAKVAPGHHKVRWKWSDGRMHSDVVIVHSGEVRIIKAGPDD